MHLQVNPRQGTNIHSTLQLQKKPDTNSLLHFIWKQQTRKRNMQKCGLRNSTESTMLPQTWKMPHLAKIMNGLICMRAWQEKPEKKASLSWLLNLKVLQELRQLMKDATASFLKAIKLTKPLRVM